MASLGPSVQNGAPKPAPVVADAPNPPAVNPQQAEQAVQAKLQGQMASIKPEQPRSSELDVSPPPKNGGPTVVPTIVIDDGEEPKELEPATKIPQDAPQSSEESLSMPGEMPSGPAQQLPDWYVIGWREASGIDKVQDKEARQKHLLQEFITEQYYGAWWHNSAVIVTSILVTHFLTRFGFGWGWLFIIIAFCSTYYTVSITRFRRNARDDIQRELVKTRLTSEHESADWLNNFLDRFWLIYEPVLSKTISSTVDQILSTNTPAFLDSLRLPFFTLGSKAPRIESVRTFPSTEPDIIMMDWKFSFTPCDRAEMTKRQIEDQANPRIELAIRIGKGLATATIPVLVEDMSLRGHVRIRMKLMANFPHVETLDISFLEKPEIDYVLKPIGGDTFGFDIANMPGLSTFISETTHSILGPMMYDPNVFTLNLEQILSGKPYDAAIGVLEVTVRSARGITGQKIGGGTPDPYVSLTIGSRAELAKTKYKNNTYNPTWMETKYLLCTNLQDSLNFNLWDYNSHTKDVLLSSAAFELAKLQEDSTQENIVAQLLKDGKQRGDLRFDVNFYPVIESQPGQEDESANSKVGIVRLVIHQAKELDNSKSLSGDLNPIARVYRDAEQSSSFSSPCIKHTNNPVWESPYEYLCSNKDDAVLTVKVIDDRDFLKDPVVGYMSIKLTDLLDAKGKAGQDWFPLSNCKRGRIRVTAEWKPLEIAGSLMGADQYSPPIGVVRLHINKAVDVKNVEATLGGKSDPYVRVQVQNVTKGKTEVINNNLNPVWDQIIYIPVHTLRENLMLECMDYQHLTKDRSLGSVELHVSDLAVESNEDPQYLFKSTGVKDIQGNLLLEKGNQHKGTLYYTAEFIPSLALPGIEFKPHGGDGKSLKRSHGEDGGYVSSARDSSDDESDDEIHRSRLAKRATPPPAAATLPAAPVTAGETLSTNGTNGKVEANGSGNPATIIEGEKKPASVKSQKNGVQMSNEEILTHQSGIIVFHIISGQISKKARLEVLLDDGYWPCFGTFKARSHHAQWDYVGEGFMKEVDFGKVWFRLNEADSDDNKEDIVAVTELPAKEFLTRAMESPQTIELKDPRDDSFNSTVLVEAKFIPVPVKLEPRETVNNQGTVRVTLIDGGEIRGADRSGKSDPYAVFQLNGQKVFKSQTKKKTLTPEWNETFEVAVTSRVGSEFNLEVFDWNQIEQAKSLGVGTIDLSTLDPLEPTERKVQLFSHKHGERGYVRVALFFTPNIIAKQRKNTSTFTSAGRAMTTIGGLPMSAGRGVLHGVTGVFKRGDKDSDDVIAATKTAAVEPNPAGTASFPSSEDGHGSNDPGTLRVTVMDAKDLPANDFKPYATIRVGDKEQKTKHTGKTDSPEWNESFIFTASQTTPQLYLWVHDHKTLGKDKEIGDGRVDIWANVKRDAISSNEVLVQLSSGGVVRLRLEFDPTVNPMAASASSQEGHAMSRTLSAVTPSRFSMRSKRPDDDSVSVKGS